VDKRFAPAKINLSLHVTGQRDDGYHLLDSLVVFAGVGDEISVTPSAELKVEVSGPFAQGVPTDDRNLVLRAARLLQTSRKTEAGATIRLVKNLPHAAGIGGGSSDAATVLRLLPELWNVRPLRPVHPGVSTLGADVPVCMHAPAPVRMRGVGERIDPVPGLPLCGLVLVNPRVEVPTPKVFAALARKDGSPMEELPDGLDLAGFIAWLSRQRNDLLAPAEGISPVISSALDRLRRTKDVLFATMSGSGATCVGVTADIGKARTAARAIQVAEMGWWVAPAPMLA
jgi:4-diphosphocytidyl-2-C-methyl-D-erythritol kinase